MYLLLAVACICVGILVCHTITVSESEYSFPTISTAYAFSAITKTVARVSLFSALAIILKNCREFTTVSVTVSAVIVLLLIVSFFRASSDRSRSPRLSSRLSAHVHTTAAMTCMIVILFFLLRTMKQASTEFYAPCIALFVTLGILFALSRNTCENHDRYTIFVACVEYILGTTFVFAVCDSLSQPSS